MKIDTGTDRVRLCRLRRGRKRQRQPDEESERKTLRKRDQKKNRTGQMVATL